MDIGNTGDGNDRTDAGFLYFYFVQTIKLVELADFHLTAFLRVMGIDDDGILVDTDCTVADFADTDTANIFVVIDSADQYLCTLVRITFRSRNVIDDSFE